MFINRYNIHFYETKTSQLEKVSAVRFTVDKQPCSSFSHGKRNNSGKTFEDIFKETKRILEEPKVKIK